jgi:hypothetical protein
MPGEWKEQHSSVLCPKCGGWATEKIRVRAKGARSGQRMFLGILCRNDCFNAMGKNHEILDAYMTENGFDLN